MNELFDIDKTIEIIIKYNLKHVILQFTDDLLIYCYNVYDYITNCLSIDYEVFIVADSTYGSSVDDVSAMHIDSDVIVYFGSDLSSSGNLPVIVLPIKKYLDTSNCVNQINNNLLSSYSSVNQLVIFYEPSYSNYINEVHNGLVDSNIVKSVVISLLPLSADLINWKPTIKTILNDNQDSNFDNIAGLLVPNNLAVDYTVLYIGDKNNQLTNILLNLSLHTIIHYNPIDSSIESILGSNTKEFRERYGGVARVKDSKVIGIIVGSMGLSDVLIKDILNRLTNLISTARKKSVVFIMGRLNEAKLCNFPEVDLYCMIANDDVAMIKPKTFHVPVVTPWELELGLGAREWTSTYKLDINSIIGNGEIDLQSAIEKVKANFDFDDDSSDSEETIQNTHSTCIITDLITTNSENRLITSSDSIITERFESREYQGLIVTIDDSSSNDIQIGLYGTSQNYKRNDMNET